VTLIPVKFRDLTDAEKAAIYLAVGQAVVDNIPYPEADLTLAIQANRPGAVEKGGPAVDNDIYTPMDEALLKHVEENPRECDWWYLDDAPRRVVKTMKIPYEWYHAEGNELEKYPKDFILVGYVGWETP
jgi:hypothetical protein